MSSPGRAQAGPQAWSDLKPLRVALLVMALMALAGILVGIGDVVVHSGTVQRFDDHVTTVVVAHRSAMLNAAMKAVTWLGSWVAVITCAVIVLLLVLRHRLSLGFLVLALVAWAGTQGATTLAKHVVQRPRPPEHLRLVATHGFSWPSGHTTTATLVFAVMAAMVWVLIHRVGPRVLAVLSWIIASTAVAFSRIELAVHWATDVLASMVFVIAWLVVAAALFGRAVTAHSDDASGSASIARGTGGGSPRPTAAGPCASGLDE